MYKIIKYILTDILRNKIIIAYILVLLSISLSIFALEDNVNKGLLSLLNLILIVLPLFSIIFSTIYLYNSSEFIELILSQPIKRKIIWIGFSFGLSIALSIAFILSIALPILIFVHTLSALMIVIVGLLLTNIFVAVALFACVKIRDKARGIGVAIILWMYFSLLFDALILFLLFHKLVHRKATFFCVLSYAHSNEVFKKYFSWFYVAYSVNWVWSNGYVYDHATKC